MGSPKTRPTVAYSWPRTAEDQRQQIDELASESRKIIKEMVDALDKGNLLVIRAALGYLDANQADIQRLALKASIGPRPPEQGSSDHNHE